MTRKKKILIKELHHFSPAPVEIIAKLNSFSGAKKYDDEFNPLRTQVADSLSVCIGPEGEYYVGSSRASRLCPDCKTPVTKIDYKAKCCKCLSWWHKKCVLAPQKLLKKIVLAKDWQNWICNECFSGNNTAEKDPSTQTVVSTVNQIGRSTSPVKYDTRNQNTSEKNSPEYLSKSQEINNGVTSNTSTKSFVLNTNNGPVTFTIDSSDEIFPEKTPTSTKLTKKRPIKDSKKKLQKKIVSPARKRKLVDEKKTVVLAKRLKVTFSTNLNKNDTKVKPPSSKSKSSGTVLKSISKRKEVKTIAVPESRKYEKSCINKSNKAKKEKTNLKNHPSHNRNIFTKFTNNEVQDEKKTVTEVEEKSIKKQKTKLKNINSILKENVLYEGEINENPDYAILSPSKELVQYTSSTSIGLSKRVYELLRRLVENGLKCIYIVISPDISNAYDPLWFQVNIDSLSWKLVSIRDPRNVIWGTSFVVYRWKDANTLTISKNYNSFSEKTESKSPSKRNINQKEQNELERSNITQKTRIVKSLRKTKSKDKCEKHGESKDKSEKCTESIKHTGKSLKSKTKSNKSSLIAPKKKKEPSEISVETNLGSLVGTVDTTNFDKDLHPVNNTQNTIEVHENVDSLENITEDTTESVIPVVNNNNDTAEFRSFQDINQPAIDIPSEQLIETHFADSSSLLADEVTETQIQSSVISSPSISSLTASVGASQPNIANNISPSQPFGSTRELDESQTNSVVCPSKVVSSNASPFAQMSEWTTKDVEQFFYNHDLQSVSHCFQDIDGEAFLEMVSWIHNSPSILTKYLYDMGCSLRESTKICSVFRHLKTQ